ncbi:MAG: IucA/IucC family protein [Patulibacter sp.]
MTPIPERLQAALTPQRWAHANRELIAKLITELVYEEVLVARRLGPADASGPADRDDRPTRGRFAVRFGERWELSYAATARSFGAWRVEPATLTATDHGVGLDALPDAAQLIAAGAPAAGASAETTAGLIGEVTATLLSDVCQLASGRPAGELADPTFPLALLDGELRGHPWIVASKGRLGFDARDIDAYAPESGRTVRLQWLAIDARLADTATSGNLTLDQVICEQVGEDGVAELHRRIVAAGGDPAQMLPLPAHPWQLRERLVTLHAGELARGELLLLGELPGIEHRPLLSLRTFADANDPARRDIKLPLSILNTSTYRGLPRSATLAAPALTDWLADRIAGNPFLAPRLELLGEVAAISVQSGTMEAIDGVPYQHTEALGALWREPVALRLRDGERAITLAALLHLDPQGESLLTALVQRSALTPRAWIDRLHDVILPPLLHVLYRYGITFSPHGQNCLLILGADGTPARLAVKDFADDAIITADPLPELDDLPTAARDALGGGVASMIASQWIQSGLLVCVYRYLAEIADTHLGIGEDAFWESAATAVIAYQEQFAQELGERFALFDFAAPAFVKLCLNRVRVLGRGYDDDAERPVAAAVGMVDNPLYAAAERLAARAGTPPAAKRPEEAR